MRDHDDVRTIVIERESGGGVGSFLLGAIVGAGIALLFAPKSGEETQEELKQHAGRLRVLAEETPPTVGQPTASGDRVCQAVRNVHDKFWPF